MGTPGGMRPAEDAAWQAQQDAAAQVPADLAADLHTQEMRTAYEGRPTVATQSQTHGTGFPALDLGSRIGQVI
jgi:hypothetical protein